MWRRLRGQVVRQLIEDYRLLFEQEITDTVVLPYLGAPALLSGRDPDPAVARAALDFLLHLARYMQCDRFAAVLAALERAAVGPRLSEGHPDVAQGSASDELQEAAARGLLRLVPATMGRLPTSRFTALWGVLLSLAAPGRMPASIRTEIIALLSRMNCTANYRPSLELPGAPEARCPVAIVRGRRGGEATGEGEEGDKAPGGGGWLDTRGLFELLVSAVKGEEDAGVFEEALAGLLRLVRNRLIIEAEDVPSLIQLLVRRLNSNSQCPLGPTVPRDAAPVFAAGLRIRRLVLGYQLLGTALGGWARERELTPAIKRAALRSLVDGLATRLVSPGRHGAAGDATALDEGAAGEAPWWVHADAGEVWDVVGAHEEVTAVCLDHLSLSSCSVPDEVPLHAGRVMDLLGLLMDAWRRSWGQGGSGKSEERGVGLVIKLLHYMKFTAVQIPLVPGGLAPGVFARALESLLALLDRARWGGLVANLANRALALWYPASIPAPVASCPALPGYPNLSTLAAGISTPTPRLAWHLPTRYDPTNTFPRALGAIRLWARWMRAWNGADGGAATTGTPRGRCVCHHARLLSPECYCGTGRRRGCGSDVGPHRTPLRGAWDATAELCCRRLACIHSHYPCRFGRHVCAATNRHASLGVLRTARPRAGGCCRRPGGRDA
jgi:hypothetical protein